MNTLMPFALIFLGLLLILGLHPEGLPTLRGHLAAALSILADLAKRALRWAGRQVTHEGELPSRQAVGQIAGALLMTAAAVVFAFCDFEVTYATLAALLGISYEPVFSGSFDRMLGASVVLLAVFGLVLTDMKGVTSLTRFALIPQGRVAAFYVALLSFVMSLALIVALAFYRGSALEGGEAAQNLPTMILVAVAGLLFIGLVFAFCSFEDFSSAVAALAVAVVWLGIGLVWLALKLADLFAELIQKWQGRPRGPGLKRLQSAFVSAVGEGNHLPKKPAVLANTDGSSSSGGPQNLEAPVPAKLQTE